MKSVQRLAAEQPRSTGVRPAEPADERSPARPLPQEVRARMESAFGADFSSVTVQEDEGPAAEGADALTRGETISLRPGLPGPESSQGLEIIGHELEHVLQQRSGRVPGTGLTEEPGLESEADEAGRRAAQGQPVTDAANAAVFQGSGEAGAQAVAQPMRRSPAYQFSFPPMPASVAAEPGGFYVPQSRYNPPPAQPPAQPPAPAPAPVMPEATPIRQAEPPGTDVGSPYAYEDPDESIVPRNRRPTL